VKIHPLHPDGTISCEMRHSKTEERVTKLPSGRRYPRPAEPYTCLSYVWGSEESPQDIIINGKRFQVRKNLFAFLSTVARGASITDIANHRQEYRLSDMWWWIDALCIDQDAIVERNRQVQRMGEIYYNARWVVAWIDNEPLIASLFRLANSYEDGKPVERTQIDDHELAIEQLVSNTYWTRAWIIQEIRLPRHLYLLAQDVSVSTHTLYSLASKPAGNPRIYRILQLLDELGAPGSDASFQLMDTSIPLLELMWRFRDKGCTDRRDLVHSVLSIAPIATTVKTDYNRTLAELAIAVLKANGTGICLCQAHIALHTLRVHLEEINSDFQIPMIKMQGLPGISLDNGLLLQQSAIVKCRQCLFRLDPASRNHGFQMDMKLAVVFCLSCNHLTHGAKQTNRLGHLILFPSNKTPFGGDQLYRMSPCERREAKQRNRLWFQRNGRCVELDPVGHDYFPKGDLHYMKLSVGALCNLISLNNRQEFQYTGEQVRSITRNEYKRHKIAQWEVIESGRL
jgi:hypothetical protein